MAATAAGLVAASPLDRRTIPTFTRGEIWDMILDRSRVDLEQLKAAPGNVIDIDLLDVIDAKPALPDIKELSKTKKVICYFSAGSYETWRADADRYARQDYGAPLDSRWNNEFWVDVRSSNVRALVKERIERAAAAGCSAVDPDNVDGYVSGYLHVLRSVLICDFQNKVDGKNQDGWDLPMSEYVSYFKFMAGVAHANGIAIGLKNGMEMIPDVLSVMDFAVNEECWAWTECGTYAPVTKAGKAVFHIEYEKEVCENPEGVVLSSLFKLDQVDTVGGQCKTMKQN